MTATYDRAEIEVGTESRQHAEAKSLGFHPKGTNRRNGVDVVVYERERRDVRLMNLRIGDVFADPAPRLDDETGLVLPHYLGDVAVVQSVTFSFDDHRAIVGLDRIVDGERVFGGYLEGRLGATVSVIGPERKPRKTS